MASVTARDMLALLQPFGARLVAGAAGLERPITWACTARASPPAYAELRGGELALLSLGTLAALHAQDDALTLARLIQHLNERGVAAIAAAGLLVREDVDTAAAGEVPTSGALDRPRPASVDEVRLADTLRLPLVSLPAGVSLADVERALIAAVAQSAIPDPVAAAPGTPRAIYDALVHHSLRGADDRALGERLADLTSAAVVLSDGREICWCAVPPEFPLARDALLNLLRRPSSRTQMRALVESNEPPTASAADAHGDATPRALDAAPSAMVAELSLGAGWRWLATTLWPRDGATLLLSLVVPAATARGNDGRAARPTTPDAARDATPDVTLTLVASLFALSLARQRDLDSSRATLRAETLDALLAGTYADEERMRARAAQLGYDLARPHIALVVSGSPPLLGEGLGERFTAELEGAWVRARAGELIALVPVAPDAAPDDLAALAGRVAALLAGEPGAWATGMSDPAAGPANLRRVAGAARDTARLGGQLLGPRHVARAADLGIYRLLLRLRETDELAAFCRQTLGPLLDEGRHAEMLLATLDAFFACNGNLSEAARRLDLHRNSLIYRLNRIRALLGHALDDPEQRLALQLALKARQVLALGEAK